MEGGGRGQDTQNVALRVESTSRERTLRIAASACVTIEYWEAWQSSAGRAMQTCRALILTVRALQRAIGVAAFAVLAGCPQRTAVWIAPSSTSERLRFEIGRSRGKRSAVALSFLRVQSCGFSPARTYWSIYSAGGTVSLDGATFGIVPSGFTEDVPPAPLESGCYSVQITGTGNSQFQVLKSGLVQEDDVK